MAVKNDNRSYDYQSFPEEGRQEYDIITGWVPSGTKVLDLGCGNGALMKKLILEKNCSCTGIEITSTGMSACRGQGLDVIQGRIDETLPFADNEFDIAVCNVTIQMVLYPEILLQQMKRIARKQIISFPNFAYFKNRLDLLLHGRMPKQLLFGYKWYNTGHIHQLSINDMQELINDTGGLKTVRQAAVPVGYALLDLIGRYLPNLFQKTVILELEKY